MLTPSPSLSLSQHNNAENKKLAEARFQVIQKAYEGNATDPSSIALINSLSQC